MATLNLFFIQYFQPFLVFIVVYSITYGILNRLGYFKVKAIDALIAFALALLFAVSPSLREVLVLALPWYTIIFILIGISILIFLFLGVKEESIAKVFSSREYGFFIFILVVVIITIFVASALTVYGDKLRSLSYNYTSSGSSGGEEVKPVPSEAYATNYMLVLVHPKVLGTAFLLIFAAVMIVFLSRTQMNQT